MGGAQQAKLTSGDTPGEGLIGTKNLGDGEELAPEIEVKGMPSTMCKTKGPARECQSESIVARMFWFHKAKIGNRVLCLFMPWLTDAAWRLKPRLQGHQALLRGLNDLSLGFSLRRQTLRSCSREFIRRCGDSPLRW